MRPGRPARGAQLLALLVALTWLGGCGASEEFKGTEVRPPRAAPALAAQNWDGEAFTLAALNDKVVIVFFGYTYCPDVCPFALAKMKQLKARLGNHADDVEMVFVSVDPLRDTLEKLATYVPHFDRSFYGLRLEFDELESIKQPFGLTIQYGQPKEGPNTGSYYYVDHTGTFFLIDRAGNLRVKSPPDATVDDLLHDVTALL